MGIPRGKENAHGGASVGRENWHEGPADQRGRIHESTGCDGGGGGGGSAGPCGKGGCAGCCGCAGAWVTTPFSRSRIMMTFSLPLLRSLVTCEALTWILRWCWPL